jgi:hypothetical protein
MIPGGCAHVTAISRTPASRQLRTPLAAAVLADYLVLDHYMRNLLIERNAWLKATLEASS